MVLEANAKANKWDNQLRWNVNIEKLKVSDDGISHIAQNLGSKVKIPKEVLRLGNIHYQGNIHGKNITGSKEKNKAGSKGNRNAASANLIAAKGILRTDVGNVQLDLSKNGNLLHASIDTKSINLGKIFRQQEIRISLPR